MTRTRSGWSSGQWLVQPQPGLFQHREFIFSACASLVLTEIKTDGEVIITTIKTAECLLPRFPMRTHASAKD